MDAVCSVHFSSQGVQVLRGVQILRSMLKQSSAQLLRSAPKKSTPSILQQSSAQLLRGAPKKSTLSILQQSSAQLLRGAQKKSTPFKGVLDADGFCDGY
eukprot:scaffold188184_cov21-Tisochrysis_lutea.AAC.3